jgi:hypothetical protein
MKFQVSRQTCEKYSISDLMKFLPLGAELLHAGGWTAGRTDRQDETNSRFLQRCKVAHKRGKITYVLCLLE